MFEYGDLVMFINAKDSTIPSYRKMRGRIVEIEDENYVKVAWYSDDTCQESMGVDTTCRHARSLIKVEVE